ncbi:hypothetical protein CMI42_05790 [Candidatus Pacearchaeota archaeon]|nr:hypothetical protein [Candidatus Pacearchaeota archaeon]|tara:strand:+ start:312 stop:806 length:495 start_codon:yes stop_codon:yes gene_type:complete
MDKFQIKNVRRALSGKYLLYFIFVFLFYFIFTIWINELYVTYDILFVNPSLGISLIFLLFIVSLLVGLNVNLLILKIGELQVVNKSIGVLGVIGICLGIIGGGCPGCIAGVFPFLVGLFGGTAVSLSVLPFNGLEIQLVSIVLLLISIYYLSRPSVCKVDFKKK